ncbi:MAG TPA: CheR family methyltransferase [Treponemataceae bacterium]|nr:CheR family methyltransferase [Treponemataceae bacterium]
MKLLKIASLHDLILSEFYEKLAAEEVLTVDLFLREIAVGHTFFFREDAHFSRLVEDIRSRSIRSPLIWCAASSTGEEPYSIIISLLESGMRDFKVLASDVNMESLRAMNRGTYHISKFQNIDERILRTYFTRVNEFTLKVRPGLRKYLSIKRLNLHETIEFENHFDYVFCRNVMIYFDDPGRIRVLRTLASNLAPRGLLFVGHSEALLALNESLRKEGSAFYRKVD